MQIIFLRTVLTSALGVVFLTGCIASPLPPIAAEVNTGTAPQYLKFSDKARGEINAVKPYVIFFHATWCPICHTMRKKIMKDIDDFPEGTIIFEADFDDEVELKNEFKVNIQTTFVVINKEGALTTKLVRPSISLLKENIATSL